MALKYHRHRQSPQAPRRHRSGRFLNLGARFRGTDESAFARDAFRVRSMLFTGFLELLYKTRGCGVIQVQVMEQQSRNQSWCERLYEDKAAHLLLYARALGLSFSEAEDVVHETFVALLALEEVPDQPEHYAFRAVRNRALNYRRSLWRRLAREVESICWFEKSESETPNEREAMRCLAKLPPEQREVIVLKIWSEYTFEQIASLLEISPNTVAGRYRYGLEKLRNCLKGKDYEQLELSRERLAEVDSAPSFA